MSTPGKTYFAHSKRIYNTPLEQQIMKKLSLLSIAEIVCPNKHIGELGNIDGYLRVIDQCDRVVVHEYQGFVGRGCYEEVQHALKNNKPVYAIRGNKLTAITQAKIFNSTDWSIQYAKLLPNP